MEYALRVKMEKELVGFLKSLNPCFNGICSARLNDSKQELSLGLNPCFNGICSARDHDLIGLDVKWKS